MKRREFIKLTSATLFVPTLPSMAKPKPKVMTLEAFCRGVLKVKLYPWQKRWVLFFDRPGRNKSNRYIRFEATGHCAKGRTFLASCFALWAAYTHPKSMVWIHGALIDVLYCSHDLSCNNCNSEPITKADLLRLWFNRVWSVRDAQFVREVKRGDWHIYV